MNLYHYYNRNTKPFMNLSDLAIEEANFLLDQIRLTKPASFCAQRPSDYMKKRLYYERILREEFQKKGGRMVRSAPHYMIVEQSAWLGSWYDDCAYIKIPIEEFDVSTLSFTYGDSHPTFSDRVNDGKEYRKKLYTYDEILGIIDKYGLPQVWNRDGNLGPERYIEVHIWSDETIDRYR